MSSQRKQCSQDHNKLQIISYFLDYLTEKIKENSYQIWEKSNNNKKQMEEVNYFSKSQKKEGLLPTLALNDIKEFC